MLPIYLGSIFSYFYTSFNPYLWRSQRWLGLKDIEPWISLIPSLKRSILWILCFFFKKRSNLILKSNEKSNDTSLNLSSFQLLIFLFCSRARRCFREMPTFNSGDRLWPNLINQCPTYSYEIWQFLLVFLKHWSPISMGKFYCARSRWNVCYQNL